MLTRGGSNIQWRVVSRGRLGQKGSGELASNYRGYFFASHGPGWQGRDFLFSVQPFPLPGWAAGSINMHYTLHDPQI
jgi:hypothetical protein